MSDIQDFGGAKAANYPAATPGASVGNKGLSQAPEAPFYLYGRFGLTLGRRAPASISDQTLIAKFRKADAVVQGLDSARVPEAGSVRGVLIEILAGLATEPGKVGVTAADAIAFTETGRRGFLRGTRDAIAAELRARGIDPASVLIVDDGGGAVGAVGGVAHDPGGSGYS